MEGKARLSHSDLIPELFIPNPQTSRPASSSFYTFLSFTY